VLVVFLTVTLDGQQPAFQNASIRPNVSAAFFSDFTEQPNGLSFVNTTVRELLLYAFGLQDPAAAVPALDFRLEGAPAWTGRERFDVIARGEDVLTDAQKRERMRTLLAQHFGLRTHTDVREQTIYALTFARADRRLGPGLQRRDACPVSGGVAARACGSGIAPVDGGIVRMFGVTIPWLATRALSAAAGRDVVDRTGLEGRYDVDLRYRPDLGMSPEISEQGRRDIEARGSLFAAVEEQLGLRLEPGRGPVEIVVVDRVERPRPVE
jgi:uncharacterized protein (TIGR03435 family)